MYMNHIPNPLDRTCWHRYSQIIDPPPANAFVFIDEHEHSIDNARFFLAGRSQWRWIDFPAARHHGGCVLSFADGHSELWQWREQNTLHIARMPPWIQGPAGVPGTDRDLQRIQQAIPPNPAF